MDLSNDMATENAPGSALAEFVLDRAAHDIPEVVRQAAAHLLLDTLGVCIAAAPMQAGRLARETAVRLYNTTDPAMRATLLFDGRTASKPGVVFAGATQIDNLDGHDGYNLTKGHIGVVAIPTLVAEAQARADLSGLDALATLAIGYEVAGRAGMALHETVTDYHTSGAWNAIGVVAIAARLRGVSHDVMRQAFGIAEYHGPRSQMMREIANPTMLHDGSGQGALVGLSAIEMAQMGFTGAPAITLEAAEVAPFWADLGTFWQTEHQYIKPYPICRWAHAAIDAVRELALAHAFVADDVTQIEIRSFHNAVQLFPGMPGSTSEAQYSLSFAIAVMLEHGQIGLEHISEAGLSDGRIAALVARTRMIEDARHEARYPAARWADVTLHLGDGRVLLSGDTQARGGPERPFTTDDITAKYREFAVPVLGDDRAGAIEDAVFGIAADPDRPFIDLTQHLFEAP